MLLVYPSCPLTCVCGCQIKALDARMPDLISGASKLAETFEKFDCGERCEYFNCTKFEMAFETDSWPVHMHCLQLMCRIVVCGYLKNCRLREVVDRDDALRRLVSFPGIPLGSNTSIQSPDSATRRRAASVAGSRGAVASYVEYPLLQPLVFQVHFWSRIATHGISFGVQVVGVYRFWSLCTNE